MSMQRPAFDYDEEQWPVKGAWPGSLVRDPITNLIAFPSFHENFREVFCHLLHQYGAVGVAIGDVDNMKTYVEQRKQDDPMLFGHLAGNALMSNLGVAALGWFGEWKTPWGCVSTFGGDEIILVGAGTSRANFAQHVQSLSVRLSGALPCNVSFASGWFMDGQNSAGVDQIASSDQCSMALVLVDRALFDVKRRAKRLGSSSPQLRLLEPRYMRGSSWGTQPAVRRRAPAWKEQVEPVEVHGLPPACPVAVLDVQGG